MPPKSVSASNTQADKRAPALAIIMAPAMAPHQQQAHEEEERKKKAQGALAIIAIAHHAHQQGIQKGYAAGHHVGAHVGALATMLALHQAKGSAPKRKGGFTND